MTERRWRFNRPEYERYQSQFCQFRRRLVTDGTWASLWREGAGSAVSVLPVLGIYAWGRDDANARLDRLSALAGVSPPTARKGLDLLSSMGIASISWAPGRHTLHFSLSEQIRTEHSLDRYVFDFRAWVAFGGAWPVMTPVQRSLYFALIAHCQFSTESGTRSLQDVMTPEDWSKAKRLGAIRDPDAFPDYFSDLYRCVRLSYSALSGVTGIPVATLKRGVSEARRLGDASPFHFFTIGGRMWYFLPIHPSKTYTTNFLNGLGGFDQVASLAEKRKYLTQRSG